MSENQEPMALNPRDAARMLGISQRTLYGWECAGLITAVRIGAGNRKTVRFPVAYLKEWLANQLAQAKAEAKGGDA